MALIKPAKANWHYTCSLCDYTSRRSPDRSGAEYRGILHERTGQHVGALITESLEPVVQTINTLGQVFTDFARTFTESVMPAFEQFQSAFVLAPPPNTPHDPSVRANRRAW